MSVYMFEYGDYDYTKFTFQNNISLENGETYWFVIEPDTDYVDNFQNLALSSDFYGGVGIVYMPVSPVYGGLKTWNNNTGVWDAQTSEVVFIIGGLTIDHAYEYVYTYYNSTYGIESRPSDSYRITVPTDLSQTVMDISYTTTSSDGQIDKLRFYRREIPAMTSTESEITDTYKLLAEVATWAGFRDWLDTAVLGPELQTLDHYCFDDTEEAGETLREAALDPFIVTSWKDRIWFAQEDDNVLYFSKLLEEDGATGWVGKAIPDYFPLDNKLEIPESSSIIGLMQLSDDSLTVYFKNGTVWLVEGGNDIYNPPSDLALRQVLSDTGLLAPAGLAAIRGRHIYMAQEGVFSFNGTSDPVFLSQEVQSIFDAIQTDYLDDTIITTFGEEIWILYDSDNDGTKDKILILNMLRSTPTWRLYDYGRAFNDIIVRKRGQNFKTVLAADATSNYVWELENGTTDNGIPIETEAETHELRGQDRILITGVELDGKYSNVPAKYQVVITDHTDNEYLYSIEPSSSDDVRGHRTGCRILTGPTVKVSIQGRSVNEDKLLSLEIKYEAR